MTTGTVTIGNIINGAMYKYRSWNGVDGRFPTLYGTQWNSYWCERRAGSQVQGSCNCASAPGPCNNGLWPGYMFESSSQWTASDELELQSKLVTAAKGHSFNLGIALGEGRETTRLVISTVSKVYGAIKHLKRGRIDLALRNLGADPAPEHRGKKGIVSGLKGYTSGRQDNLDAHDVSSLWLEIQYGWRPLLQDVYEAGKAYEALTQGPRTSSFVVSRQSKVNDFQWPLPSELHQQPYVYNWSSKTGKRIKYVFVEDLQAPRSLGLTNPASIAWELIPFSFVADWFIPIGTYLDNLDTIPNLKGTFLSTSRTFSQGKSGVHYNHWFYSCINYGGSSKWELTVLNRSAPSTSLTVAKPVFVPFGEALSLGRMKNAVALLHQLVK